MGIISDLGPLLPALAGIGGFFSGAKFVQEGERGLKLRFGKVVRRRGVPKVYRPGFTIVIPAAEHLHRTHVRVRTVEIDEQEVVLPDGMEFSIGGVVQFRVGDNPDAVYMALFETDDLEVTVADYVSGRMRDAASEMPTYQHVLNRGDLTTRVTSLIEEQLREWGLTGVEFRLTDCSPTPQSARAILIAAETRMRADALCGAAAKVAGDENVLTLPATVAAALIGTPVATALNDGHVPAQ